MVTFVKNWMSGEDPEASILDTLYIGDSPAVLAMRDYESALSQGLEGDELQRAYDAMDAHEGWNFESGPRNSRQAQPSQPRTPHWQLEWW